jgi:hypothetical protein
MKNTGGKGGEGTPSGEFSRPETKWHREEIRKKLKKRSTDFPITARFVPSSRLEANPEN